MAKNFPHLQDTEFPYLAGENAYAYKNDFDYTRWSDNVTIKLCSVNVDDENRCIYDAAARDAIFSEMPGYEFRAASHIVGDTLKLPLPFEMCANYNYLAIRFPIPPSAADPLDYANADGIYDYFWIIEGMEYSAPSVTRLTLKLDVWGTFGDSVSVSYMELERGHAPMSLVDCDSYLEDPLRYAGTLGTVEDSFEDIPILRSREFEDYGNGEKYVVFGISMDPKFISNMVAATAIGGSSSATFENRLIAYPGVPDRTANYYTVNDYQWGYTVKDYNNCLTNTVVPSAVDGIWSSLSFVAVAAKLAFADDFIAKLFDEYQYFLKTVETIFICSRDMLTFGDKISMFGFDAHIVQGREWILHDISLSKDMFGYPERYANLSKLYSFPYATLRVSDGESEIDVRIQDISKDAEARSKSILSTLDFQTMLRGIAGADSANMVVHRLDGSQVPEAIPSGEWQRFILSNSIPTYSIYLSNMHSLAIDNYTNDMVVNRNAAIASYHASNRSSNTNWQNAVDNADTSIANCATQTATNTAITNHGNDFLENSKDANVSKLNSDHAVDVIATSVGVAASAITDLMSYVTNQSAGASAAAIGFVGDLVGLRWGQAVSGAANWGVSAAQAAASYNITHSKDAALNAASAAQANGKTNNATTLISNVTSYQKSTASAVTSSSNSGLTTQNSRSNATLKANARYTFEDTHAADANSLSIEQQRMYAKYRDAKRSGNTAQTADSGTKALDSWNLRGIDFQIVTQRDSDIRTVGDRFARYGYRFDGAWDFQTWDVMEHFTYWKCREVWIEKGSIPEFAIRTMREELANGVTIWRSIDDIMRTSIYDNEVAHG